MAVQCLCFVKKKIKQEYVGNKVKEDIQSNLHQNHVKLLCLQDWN